MPSLQERDVQGFHPMLDTIRSMTVGSGSSVASVAETQKRNDYCSEFESPMKRGSTKRWKNADDVTGPS